MAFFITASWEAVPAACPPASPSIPEAGPHPSSWDLPPRAGAADAGAGPPRVLLPGGRGGEAGQEPPRRVLILSPHASCGRLAAASQG